MNYYPFGMVMPARNYSSPSYRYGFNGKEKDDEVKGSGNHQDYGMRVYDPRISRFLSADPLIVSEQLYPELSSYQFASNTPIQAIDLDGLEGKAVQHDVQVSMGGGGVDNSFLGAKDIGMNMVYNATGSVPINLAGTSWNEPGGSMKGIRSNTVAREVNAVKAVPKPAVANTPGQVGAITKTNSTTQVKVQTKPATATNQPVQTAKISPAEQAKGWQNNTYYPNADAWRNIELKEGHIVVQGIGGKSDFFTTTRGYNRSGGSVDKLWESLQVRVNPEYGPRMQVGFYKVVKNIPAAIGTTYANPQYGSGGSPQLYIPNWEAALKQIRIDDLKK